MNGKNITWIHEPASGQMKEAITGVDDKGSTVSFMVHYLSGWTVISPRITPYRNFDNAKEAKQAVQSFYDASPDLGSEDLVQGDRYNWKNQPERLIYLGKNWSGNGYWHQFALVEEPDKVWCEVLDSDLKSFEKTV